MTYLKRIFMTLIILMTICVTFLLLAILKDTKAQPFSNADTVLILGARVLGDTPQNAFPGTVLKERLDAAIPYLKANKQAVAVVSGGQGKDEVVSEAEVMADYLAKNGIEKQRIIQENTSTRTKENIEETLKKRKMGKTVIVTSDFHMFRSLLLARRLGIQTVSGLAAPSTMNTAFRMYIREIAALGYGLAFDHGK